MEPRVDLLVSKLLPLYRLMRRFE